MSPAAARRIATAMVLYPGTTTAIYPGPIFTRHQPRVHAFAPPGLPLTCSTRMTRAPSGFAPARARPAHARQGRDRLRAQAWNHAASTTSCQPPISEFTRHVRPRVAPPSDRHPPLGLGHRPAPRRDRHRDQPQRRPHPAQPRTTRRSGLTGGAADRGIVADRGNGRPDIATRTRASLTKTAAPGE
jgi:hypothetical protein